MDRYHHQQQQQRYQLRQQYQSQHLQVEQAQQVRMTDIQSQSLSSGAGAAPNGAPISEPDWGSLLNGLHDLGDLQLDLDLGSFGSIAGEVASVPAPALVPGSTPSFQPSSLAPVESRKRSRDEDIPPTDGEGDGKRARVENVGLAPAQPGWETRAVLDAGWGAPPPQPFLTSSRIGSRPSTSYITPTVPTFPFQLSAAPATTGEVYTGATEYPFQLQSPYSHQPQGQLFLNPPRAQVGERPTTSPAQMGPRKPFGHVHGSPLPVQQHQQHQRPITGSPLLFERLNSQVTSFQQRPASASNQRPASSAGRRAAPPPSASGPNINVTEDDSHSPFAFSVNGTTSSHARPVAVHADSNALALTNMGMPPPTGSRAVVQLPDVSFFLRRLATFLPPEQVSALGAMDRAGLACALLDNTIELLGRSLAPQMNLLNADTPLTVEYGEAEWARRVLDQLQATSYNGGEQRNVDRAFRLLVLADMKNKLVQPLLDEAASQGKVLTSQEILCMSRPAPGNGMQGQGTRL